MRGWKHSLVVRCVAAALLTPSCGEPQPVDRFLEAYAEFDAPPPGRLHFRYLKRSKDAPPARSSLRLEELLFPESEGWRVSGHEFRMSEPTALAFEIGDRVDMRPESDWPDAGASTVPPAWLLRFAVDARADTSFVLLVGHKGLNRAELRAAVVGDVDRVFNVDGEASARTLDAEIPSAYVYDVEVPEQHRANGSGTFWNFETARFPTVGKYGHLPLPADGYVHLASWVHVQGGSGSSGGMQNELRYLDMGDVSLRSNGVDHEVSIAGEPVDWTEYPNAFWTVRFLAVRPQE